MGLLFEFATQLFAHVFGQAVAEDHPEWVKFLVELGCLVTIGLIAFGVWFIARIAPN